MVDGVKRNPCFTTAGIEYNEQSLEFVDIEQIRDDVVQWVEVTFNRFVDDSEVKLISFTQWH